MHQQTVQTTPLLAHGVESGTDDDAAAADVVVVVVVVVVAAPAPAVLPGLTGETRRCCPPRMTSVVSNTLSMVAADAETAVFTSRTCLCRPARPATCSCSRSAQRRKQHAPTRRPCECQC